MSNKTKKQLLLNLPYFIAGFVCTNLGDWIFKRFDVFLRTPTSRAILHAMAIFLGIFAFQVHSKPQTRSAAHTNQQIHRMQTWHRIGTVRIRESAVSPLRKRI